ncbi:hypothetical protein [Herbaspirillum sp. alder98]|uniref:hypothetical protein n=1 Tax=Herbaspirillum sp. alder98 TaxID=2913096 RepID=UPI001CD88CFA|nr:hypothetical protein [Herbaspirillum sp. alder98]MCA1326445.1 hypothetical protein [Herbaspirillum sp. alder98]
MNTRSSAALLTASALLSACGWSSGVTALDHDTYMLTASSPWQGNDGVAIKGLQQADAYCRNLGRRMRVVGSERSDGLPVVLPPRALLTFKCDKPA